MHVAKHRRAAHKALASSPACYTLRPRYAPSDKAGGLEGRSMNPDEYLLMFFAELERLVDGHGTRHAISTTRAGELEVRMGAGDWYWAAQVAVDDDPVRAAQAVARAGKSFPTSI